jgi:ribosomal protein L21
MLLGMDILGKSKMYAVTRSKSKQNEESENEMVECEVHSPDLNEDVDLIDFSKPDEEIQEDIDIEDVNELPEQGESIGLEHLSNVNVETIVEAPKGGPYSK